MLCYDAMLWCYVMMLCYDAMLWCYVMILCYDAMLWWQYNKWRSLPRQRKINDHLTILLVETKGGEKNKTFVLSESLIWSFFLRSIRHKWIGLNLDSTHTKTSYQHQPQLWGTFMPFPRIVGGLREVVKKLQNFAHCPKLWWSPTVWEMWTQENFTLRIG